MKLQNPLLILIHDIYIIKTFLIEFLKHKISIILMIKIVKQPLAIDHKKKITFKQKKIKRETYNLLNNICIMKRIKHMILKIEIYNKYERYRKVRIGLNLKK